VKSADIIILPMIRPERPANDSPRRCGSAELIILPTVRIERFDDAPTPKKPGDGSAA